MNFHHRGVVEESEEGARKQNDDERIERDFTEHERPVVGEDLAPELLHGDRDARTLVQVVGDAARYAHSSTRRGGCGS